MQPLRWSIGVRKMAPRKLSRDKQREIREKITDIVRKAEPTPFSAEGPCRAGIRSSLCLQGWAWGAADMIAADIVAAALSSVGARRPSWLEGQPEYTQPGALPIQRDNCVRCRKPLPEGHWRFCSHECNTAYHGAKRWERAKEEIGIKYQAQRAAWSAKQSPRVCVRCGESFQPMKNNQQYCSRVCVFSIDRVA